MQKLEQPYRAHVIDPVIEQIRNDPTSYTEGDPDEGLCYWINTLNPKSDEIDWASPKTDPEKIAQNRMGLTEKQAKDLFSFDFSWPEPWRTIRESELIPESDIAINLLEHIRDYGPTAILGE